MTNHEAGVINEYTTSLVRFDGYQASTTHGQSTKQLPGDSTQQYDANGYLVGIVDATQSANNRTFVNDATGKALYVNQAGNVQRQLIVNGEVLGLHGAGVDPNAPASGYNNNPNFANIVDFDFGYARVSANYPSASPGAYTIRSGDTLQSISQSAYGDSALWYRIAEANGLASNSDLRVGQTLNIPNRVSTVNNNSTTFKPYDPSQIEGDKTPSLATPQPKRKKSGIFGKLLMIIVAIVVTIFTAGAMAVAMSAVTAGTSTMAAGMAALAGGTLGTTALTAGVMGSIAATAVVSSAVGAAVGSIVSQGVGIATGVQDEFSWRTVGLSALSAGATAGLGGTGLLAGSDTASFAVRAAAANAASQGIAVATGLQKKFDWRGVAAAAVGGGVGHAVAPSMGGIFGPESFGQRLATGVISGAAAAVARGGRVVAQQVAVDAFGNALGQSLASVSSGTPTAPAGDALGEFINENLPRWEQRQANYDRIVGVFGQAQGGGERAPGVLVADAGDVLRLSKPTSTEDDVYYANIINVLQARDAARQAASANFRAGESRATAALYASGAGDVRETTPVPQSTLTAPSVPGIGDGYFDDNGQAWLAPITVQATPSPTGHVGGASFQEVNDQRVIGGTYDRFSEIGRAGSSGNWGDVWRHIAFEASPQARDAAIQRIFPPQHPDAVRLQRMANSPIGTVASTVGRVFGADQQRQDALLMSGSLLEQLGGTGSQVYKQTLTAPPPPPGMYARARAVGKPARALPGITPDIKRGVVQFEGMEVRAVRDLGHVDVSTLRAMQKYGFAAKDGAGSSLVLHHHRQNPAGPIIEMPAGNHSIGSAAQHPFGNTKGSGLTVQQRAEFDQWRVEYWKWRATQELQSRGLQ